MFKIDKIENVSSHGVPLNQNRCSFLLPCKKKDVELENDYLGWMAHNIGTAYMMNVDS